MEISEKGKLLEKMKRVYPEKFVPEKKIFSNIRAGDRIFISTGCGEPQYLVQAMIDYVNSNPKAFFDTEIIHVWTLGVAPYTDKKFHDYFRHNSFFIGSNTRATINEGAADYTPIFLSSVPELFRRKMIPIDVALIQTSPPDEHGYMSLGVSVDIVKAAVEISSLVIAQVNNNMPRTHGDSFINIKNVDFVIPYDEPLLEYRSEVSPDIAEKVGKYVARIVEDGDTLQVGYGSLPDAILPSLLEKKHLGIHTELLTDNIVALMKAGVIDNTMKTLNPDKTVATFCMGKKETYDFINNNPGIEFRTIDYTNNPLTIAKNKNMVTLNSTLEIDLTGQASAESLGKTFYSGIGGQADFNRGATMAKGGKTILALESTAGNGQYSRIVPFLKEGAGVTLTRGDIQYVATEYGIVYLHGKNIRERAMALISIAHPNFRSWLIEEAKKLKLIYKDQTFITGKKGEYPEHLERYRTTRTGLTISLRPVKLVDEPLLKKFFYSLSDLSMYRRFVAKGRYMPHEKLQSYVVIDYSKEMGIIATIEDNEKEIIAGLGQYFVDERTNTAEVAFVVRDDFQNKGIGTELLSYLTLLAKKQGIKGFTAEVLIDNGPMLHVFDKMGFEFERNAMGMSELKMNLR